jgi:transcriptional antiterminator RfaH
MSLLSERVLGRRLVPLRIAADQDPTVSDSPLAETSMVRLPWYVVHTKVRQEQTACDNLARQGYAVYLPRIKILKRRRGRQQTQLEAMFPRYIFVRPGSAAHSIAPVRSTLGVVTLVRFGQEPAAMREEVLARIRDFEARQNDAPEDVISPFQPGGRICVVDGPLTGLEGLISDVSQERVVVLMHLLGASTRVTMSYHQVIVAH